MKIAMMLILFSFAAPALAGESCERCADMERLQNQMKQMKPDFGNRATIDTQERIVDKGSEIAYSLLKQKKLSLETSKALLAMMAKVMQYDQASVIASDNAPRFRRHFNSCDKNTFRPALEQIQGKITDSERKNMIDWFGVDPKSNPCK